MDYFLPRVMSAGSRGLIIGGLGGYYGLGTDMTGEEKDALYERILARMRGLEEGGGSSRSTAARSGEAEAARENTDSGEGNLSRASK